ncbi:putative transcription factor B3-Domain family [Helianthus annuus]|nr:putative transcription factor B3-Domain family [Helianthus annuus]
MAASPMNNTEPSPDLQLAIVEWKPPNLPEPFVTIAQLPPSKTSPLAPLTPSSELSGIRKRKRLKPEKLEFSSIYVEKKRSSSKDKAVHDLSRRRLRLGKENATKGSKAPVKISQAMIRAREVQSTLGNEHPTFVKTMLGSHVTRCFWMGLPFRFGRSFLPKQDSLMVIEDENGDQSNCKLIAYRYGLSAGWREFAVRRKLREGDVLIFQLVESCKFKVYIVRANDLKEVDGAVSDITHNAHEEHMTTATINRYTKSKGRKCSSPSSLPLTKVKKQHKRCKPPTQTVSHNMDHSAADSQVQEGSPKPNLSLKELKTFKDFHIMVDKQCIDSELSEEIRINYFKLCIGRNEILHAGVREGLFYKLVAGVIGETVNIANMIRNCKLTTRKEEFDVWDSSLKSFELIGMKVGFLRDRIRALANLAFESEDAKRYVEAKEERSRNANEIKVLLAKLVKLYESNKKINGVVDGLKEKAERYEIEFQKKVDAPW